MTDRLGRMHGGRFEPGAQTGRRKLDPATHCDHRMPWGVCTYGCKLEEGA